MARSTGPGGFNVVLAAKASAKRTADERRAKLARRVAAQEAETLAGHLGNRASRRARAA